MTENENTHPDATSAAVPEGSVSEKSVSQEKSADGGKSRGRMILASIAGVLVLALVGLVVWQGLEYRKDLQIEQAREEVVAAASEQAVAMLAYNFDTAGDKLAGAAEGLTGDFRDDYTKLIDEVIVPGAKEKQLTVQVTVQAGGVISAQPDSASVLLYLNQITTSSDAPEAQTAGSRVRIDLEKVDDRWLVSNLEPI